MSDVRHLVLVPFLTAAAITGLVAVIRPPRAHAYATIIVDTPYDEDADNGSCSLREAIIAANTNADYHGCMAYAAGISDVILFDLELGTPIISIGATPLPAITEALSIDGGDGRVELHGPGGPLVSGHHGLIITRNGFGSVLHGLVVNNFADDGVYIDADEVYVYGCFIGTDATGMIAEPNQGFGVQVFGGNGVRIGGGTTGEQCTGACNLISGAVSSKANVLLDLNATGALVRGNFIGTDVTGRAAIDSNNAPGVIDKGRGDRIGGSTNTTPGRGCTGDCNLISGNILRGGIFIDQAATGSTVQGNFIGTDVTGTVAIGNGIFPANGSGIVSQGIGTVIGGTVPQARNVVSGNVGGGIAIRGASTVVQGNYIGTNSAGTAALSNGLGISVVQADGATIGGSAPGAGNVISGASTSNGGSGVRIDHSTNVQVVGNLIGTAADGDTPLPNASDGVYIFDQSSNNIVGGQLAAAGNVIAFNGGAGVHVDGNVPPVRSNTIRANSIYSNDAAGIALTDGSNDALAPPTIAGSAPLRGTACAPCGVEIFSDSEDEGRVFEGSLFTNDGNWTFDAALHGPQVTATNTDMSNNTSEFSAPFALTPATPTASMTPSSTPVIATSTATGTRTPPATFTGSSAPSRTATAMTTASPSAVSTATPTVTRNASPGATVAACTGDCNADHTVTIDELITGVRIALGSLAASACPSFRNARGAVDIAQLVAAVGHALNGC